MKHNELRSIGHNIADSLASGIGLMIGVYTIHIFEEAKKSDEGFLTVDFLKGTITGGGASESLSKAVRLYRDALPDLCEKQGVDISSFRELTACFHQSKKVCVTIGDKNNRRSTDEYTGSPLQHLKTTDDLGRIRSNRNSIKT